MDAERHFGAQGCHGDRVSEQPYWRADDPITLALEHLSGDLNVGPGFRVWITTMDGSKDPTLSIWLTVMAEADGGMASAVFSPGNDGIEVVRRDGQAEWLPLSAASSVEGLRVILDLLRKSFE
jgi:hypothetical protein